MPSSAEPIRSVSGLDVPLVLRGVRRLAGLSQRQLARRVDVSGSAVAAYEAGTRAVPLAVLERLLDVCSWQLAVVDRAGAVVDAPVPDPRRDRVLRRYPAHLVLREVDAYGSWWGDRWGDYWCRPPRPDWTYHLRARDRREGGGPCL